MRILHVYKAYPPTIGGIEHHLAAVAQHHAAAGHAVCVLCVTEGPLGGENIEHGVHVIRSGRIASLASAPFGLKIATTILRSRPDITHLHAPYPPGELAWLALGRRPMVLSYHADIVRQKVLGKAWAPLQQLVLSRADRIMVGSPVLAQGSRPLARHAERVRVVPYGVDVERFAPTPDRIERARRLRDADPFLRDRFVLAFVGRLRYYKGLDVLIDALAHVEGACVIAVGSGEMGPAWKARASAFGVQERIRWLGDVSDEALPDILHGADAYVFPSNARSESFGIAMAEAMAAGLPIISTELGTGTSWVNRHGLTGLVVPAGDPERLAGAILELMNDPDRRSQMGRAARERAIKTFSSAAMLRGIDAVYAEALEQNRIRFGSRAG